MKWNQSIYAPRLDANKLPFIQELKCTKKEMGKDGKLVYFFKGKLQGDSLGQFGLSQWTVDSNGGIPVSMVKGDGCSGNVFYFKAEAMRRINLFVQYEEGKAEKAVSRAASLRARYDHLKAGGKNANN